MPRFEITVSLDVPEGVWTLGEIERAVHDGLRDVGKDVVARTIESMEPEVLSFAGGTRQRQEARYVLTRFGEVRYERYKVKSPHGYGHPLDRALGLEPYQTVSPALCAELAYLAQAIPFRQAAEIASRLVGIPIDHRRVWRLAQRAGERVRELQEHGLGGPPPELPEGEHRHEMTVVELDGTGLRCREGGTEAKLAVWYAGKDVVHDGTGPRRRRAYLVAKGAYATTAPAPQFARTAAALCQRHIRYRNASHRLGISDGGNWIPLAMAVWFGISSHQLDHFHGRRRCTDIPGISEAVGQRWWGLALRGRLDEVVRQVRRRVQRGTLDPHEARNLLDFLRQHTPHLHAARDLRRRGAPAELCVSGSGAVEHNIDLVVARRMKRRGMFWSRRGADNMLALRCAALDSRGWKEVFGAAA